MRMRISLVVLGACAGLAMGEQMTGASGADEQSFEGSGSLTISLDISGMYFWDLQGAAFNEILDVQIGSGMTVSAIGWDLTLSTVGASWASEATFGFNDVLFLAPGVGDDFPGTGLSYSSGGLVDLTDNGFDNLMADVDGYITIELFESFDDVAGEIDAYLESGSVLRLEISYPAPGSAMTLGLGLLCCGRRRR